LPEKPARDRAKFAGTSSFPQDMPPTRKRISGEISLYLAAPGPPAAKYLKICACALKWHESRFVLMPSGDERLGICATKAVFCGGDFPMNFHNGEEVFDPYGGGKIHVIDSAAVLDLHQIECENFQVIQDSIFEPSDKRAILEQEEEVFPFPDF
jgi:hypothetical protein